MHANSTLDGADETPKCGCGLIATMKTSNKDNENKGRQFWTCVKSAARCNFFQVSIVLLS